MPRDIFGDVVRPSVKLGTRAWYTVPLSIAAHIAVAAVVIVVPLMATDALPAPSRMLASFVATAPPPPPPPVAPAAPQQKQQTSPDSNPDAAPLNAPDKIADEAPPSPPPLGTVAEGGLPGPFGASTGTTTGLVPPPPPPPAPALTKPLPVGGDIKPPAKIKDVPPVYPRIAQENRVSGTVIIQATIGVDGRVTNAQLLKSVPLLDDAALTAVRQWRFTPTRLNGVPIPVLMTVTVAFRLD